MIDLTRIVGLTGGMGAGKSTLVQVARKLGVKVFDCDATVHEIYQDEMFLLSLDESFGPIQGNPREYMGQKIVQNPEILKDLEELMSEFFQSSLNYERQRIGKQEFMLLDAPILYETGMDKLCDFVIAVQCPRAVREQRVMQRPGMTLEKMTALMDKQISESDRLSRAQYVIHNIHTVEDAEKQMSSIIAHLKDFYE